MDKLTIGGILNFRSVPPYRAADGRLKSGAFYRCGAFDDIDAEGIAQLERIGLCAIFDLRSEQEKARAPSPLLVHGGFRIVSQSHRIRSGDLSALLENPVATPEQCVASMARIYAESPVTFVEVFGLLFRSAAEQGAPFAVHCTAGKDRTGIAVALLLDLLGVDRSDILEDYLKSNAARAALDAKLGARTRAAGLGRIVPHLIDAISTCRPEYLLGMFDTIDEQFGGTGAYATRALGLDDAALDAIRARFIE